MNPKMKNDLDDLCTFVSQSANENDYLLRFNLLISIFIFDFEQKIKNKKNLPYFISVYIDEYNDILNDVVKKLNNLKSYDNIFWRKDVFYVIVKYNFEEAYLNWKYTKECILN